jgi:RNA polymerase sigma-70 factor, ECF subfamily
MLPSVSEERTSQTDASIIEAVRNGNADRFSELVLAHEQRLFSFMYLMLGNRQDAEDVTQDAFVKSFQKLDMFQGKCSFSTWLHRIAYRLAIDFLRKGATARKLSSASVDQNGDWLPSGDSGPAEEMEKRESQQLVRQAMSQLDDEQRAILSLREYQGMDYADIATTLEVAVGTVRSRLHRARLELRNLLKVHFEAESAKSSRAANLGVEP